MKKQDGWAEGVREGEGERDDGVKNQGSEQESEGNTEGWIEKERGIGWLREQEGWVERARGMG